MQLRAERSEKSCRLIRAMSIYNLHLCVCGFWCLCMYKKNEKNFHTRFRSQLFSWFHDEMKRYKTKDFTVSRFSWSLFYFCILCWTAGGSSVSFGPPVRRACKLLEHYTSLFIFNQSSSNCFLKGGCRKLSNIRKDVCVSPFPSWCLIFSLSQKSPLQYLLARQFHS